MIKNTLNKLLKRKFVTLIGLLVIISAGYYGYKTFTTKSAGPQYVTAPAAKGTLIVSVSGTGQVLSSSQIAVKPRVASTVAQVVAQNGQDVESGAILMQLDATDAGKAVRDAHVNLDSAKLALQKLVQPADALTLMQSQNALTQAQSDLEKLKLSQATDYQKAQEAKQKAIDEIAKAYEDAFNEVSNSFLDLPAVVTTLDDVLHGSSIGQADKSIGSGYANTSTLMNTTKNENDKQKLQPLIDSAERDYASARTAYDANLIDYKAASRFSDRSVIEALLTETLETTKLVAEAAKSQTTLLDAWIDLRTARNASDYLDVASKVTAYRSTLNTDTGQVNGHLSSLLAAQQALQDDQNTLTSADRDLKAMDQNHPLDLAAAEQSVQEKTTSLTKLKAGPDPLDIQTAQLTVRQRENALADVKQQLADYTIRAPLAGTVTNINVNPTDPVSSGTSVATLVAKQQLAQVSLNEVDVAKVKVGQKATMTFDAIDGLEMTGKVAEIDTLGTVTQGVVSYNVKISFDTQDDRIKPGMSVSAAIITDVKQDVLMVPNSAVKSQGGQGSYVEILQNGAPVRRQVQVGVANDTMTEVSGNIQDGDTVVTQIITSTTSPSQSTQSQGGALGGLRIPGLGGGFGGGGR